MLFMCFCSGDGVMARPYTQRPNTSLSRKGTPPKTVKLRPSSHEHVQQTLETQATKSRSSALLAGLHLRTVFCRLAVKKIRTNCESSRSLNGEDSVRI